MSRRKIKSSYQFRTADLLLATAVIGVGIVIAPQLRLGPIYGSTLSAVLIVLLGGVASTVSCRLIFKRHTFLHQFLGAFLFAIVGFTLAGILPSPAVWIPENAYVLIWVYVGGLLGGVAGGSLGRLSAAKLSHRRQPSPGQRKRATYVGLVCLALAATGVAAILVIGDEPIRWGSHRSIVLMVLGSLLGTATGVLARPPAAFRQRLLGALLFSVAAFYGASTAAVFAPDLHRQTIVILSVYVSGMIGGVVGAVLFTSAPPRERGSRRSRKLVRYAAMAPFAIAAALAMYRTALVLKYAQTINYLGRTAGIALAEGPAYEGVDPIAKLDLGEPADTGLRRFLGLTVVKAATLDSISRPPVELDSDINRSLASVLPTLTHMVIHAKHLDDREFVALLNSDRLPYIRSLQIHGPQLNDSLLSRLPPLPSLRLLFLPNTGISDISAEQIAKFENLTYLDLHGTSATDAAVEHVAKLPSLEMLFLGGTAVTDLAVPYLEELPKLRGLDICSTKITNAAVSRLMSLPNCRVDVDLRLGAPASGHVARNGFDEWRFRVEEETLMYFQPRSTGTDLRWTVGSTAPGRKRTGMSAYPPDWDGGHGFGRGVGSTAARLQLDATTSQVLRIRRGTHGLRVESKPRAANYQFLLVNMSDSATDITPRLGEIIEAELRPGAEASIFRFDATKGMRLRLDRIGLDGTSSGRLQLVNARGEQLFDVPLEAEIPSVLIDSQGPFYLLVEGASEDISSRTLRFRLELRRDDNL